MRFDNWDTQDGLPSATVLSMVQDKKGYMWFGTIAGIVKFNGDQVQLFSPETPLSAISDNFVFSLEVDDSGMIWAGTRSGLNRINPETGEVQQFFADDDGSGLPHNSVREIRRHSDGHLWIATDMGITIVDPQALSFTPLSFAGSEEFRDMHPYIRTFDFDSDGAAYLVTRDNGICIYYPLTELCKAYLPAEENSKTLAVFIDRSSRVWVADRSGEINVYQKDGNFVRSFELKKGSNPMALTQGPEGKIWVASLGGPLTVFNEDLSFVTEISADQAHNMSFGSTSSLALLFDNVDDLWVASASSGVYRQNRLASSFAHMVLPHTAPQSTVWSFSQTGPDKLWIGGGGWVELMDPETLNSTLSLQLNGNVTGVVEVATGENEYYLVGTMDGLWRIENIHNGPDKVNVTHLSEAFSIYQLLLIDRHLFAATNEGLQRFPLSASGPGSPIPVAADTSQNVGGSLLFSLAYDQRNLLYFTGYEGTVWSLELETMQISTVLDTRTMLGKPASIWHLSLTQAGNLLLATDSYGLLIYDLINGDTDIVDFEDGLLNNSVYSALELENASIWLGTASGLVEYDSQAKKIVKILDNNNGAQSNDYAARSVLLRSDGCFYAGGTNYFNLICPDKLESMSGFSDPQFSNLRINYKPAKDFDSLYTWLAAPNNSEKLSFSHEVRQFALNFGAIRFAKDELIKYQYRLTGFQDDWVDVELEDKSARYTALPQGKYGFEVRVFDPFQADKMKTTSLAITIFPSPWQTWYAFVAYFLLLLITIVIGVKIKIRTTQQLNKELQQKVQERTQQLEQQKQAIEVIAAEKVELLQHKDYMLAMISHEMKTPLTVIQGASESLNSLQHNDEKQNRLNTLMAKNCQRLKFFVQHILMTANIQKSSPDKHQLVPFTALVKEVVNNLNELAKKRNQSIELLESDNLSLEFDPLELEIVVANLVKNAIYHSGADTSIRISVKKQDDKACFVVSDNGVGMESNQLDNMVRPRSEGQTDMFDSSGLGLGLVRDIVEVNKGTIQVKSELGLGTCFRVEFSDAKQSEDSAEYRLLQMNSEQLVENVISTDEDKLLVLIIDDEPDVLDLMQLQLDGEYRVQLARDTDEATSFIARHLPDVILLDQMMPGRTGTVFIQLLRSDKRTSVVPIVLFSASVDADLEQAAYRVGADAFLEKPVTLKLLTDSINKVYGQRLNLAEFKAGSSESDIDPYSERVDKLLLGKVLKLIREHYQDEHFGTRQISEKLFMTERTMQRKLKLILGEKPSHLLYTYRCKRAKSLIFEGVDMELAAQKCGFSSSTQMRRWFHIVFERSPSEFKTLSQKTN